MYECKDSAVSLFVDSTAQITSSEALIDLFAEPILAEAGSNLKAMQVKSLTYWRDFVSDLEGKSIWSINYWKLLLCFSDEDPANLTGLLQYLTGARAIPPLGLPMQPCNDHVQ